MNGDGASSLSSAPTCSTTATSSSPVGTYPSSCSGAADPNYTISYAAGTVQVVTAPLLVAASSPAMTYGGTVPTITPSYSGFVNGDNASSLTTPPTCSTTATSSSPVGSYPSSCAGASDPNYSITYVAGTTVVGSAALVIRASSGTMTYGGAAPTITPSYSGFVNGDSASSLATRPTCSTLAAADQARRQLHEQLLGCGRLQLHHHLCHRPGVDQPGAAHHHGVVGDDDLRRFGSGHHRPRHRLRQR